MLVEDGDDDREPREYENSSFGVMGMSVSRIVTIGFTIYVLHLLTKMLRKYIKLHISMDTDRSNDNTWKAIYMNALRSLSNGVDNCFTVMEDGFPYKVYLYWTEESKPEVRRFCMEKNVGIAGQMKFFLAKIQELYPKLRTMTYTIAWKDEDEDEVLISTDDEVQTMVTASGDVDVIRLYVRVTGTKSEDDAEITDVPVISAATTSVGAGPTSVVITCDGCGNTVTGFRYKCLTCDDYDLCVYCETEGRHPEHCVVRVPTSNITVPLIRASIKKSRKFLKSVASQVHDENKRQRRERGAAKHSREHSAPQCSQGKADSHHARSPRRNWVEVFTKYMEEFTNLAGDLNRGTEPKEPKTSTSEPKILHPTNEEIDANPWNLSEADLEKLQHACKFARQNALRASVKTFNKMVEVATTAAEEAVARSSIAFSFPPLRASMLAPQTPNATAPAQVPTPQASTPPKASTPPAVATPAEPVAMPANETFKPTPEVAKLAQKAKAKLAKASHKKKLEERIREALLKAEKSQAKLNSLNATVTQEPKTDEDEQACPEGAVSSNASSAGSEKGWTVLDDLKDDLAEVEISAVNLLDMPEEFQDRVRIHAKIYPPLNAATAVLDPQVPAAAASAPPPSMPEKKTQAMATITMPAQTTPAQTVPAQAVPTLGAHIQAALEHMIAMGFNNENDWLTHLLNSNDGNIAAVLELISPAIK